MHLLKDVNTQLLALKMVVFCWFAAAACLMPYQSIHMRQLGISVEETAVVYSKQIVLIVLPFVSVFGSPIAGFVADKMGNYKPVLCISLIVTILTSLAMMMIPSSGDPEKYQTREEEVRHLWIFWLYFIFRVVFSITTGVCFTLLDATSIALCEKHNTSFGRVRFWGILGTGLFSPICGWLVDYLSHGLGEFETDYSPTFHFFNFFVLLTLISSAILNIEVAAPPKNMFANIKLLLKSFPVWVLFAVILILGTLWGFVESFLFWYLLDLHAPKFLLGMTLTTGALVSLPFLVSSNWFVVKLGYENLMIIALGFYFIRCFGYSLIQSPFWCFPFEAMEAFTYHLMWVAATVYSAELAPEGLRATMLGAVGSLHYGVGRASGSMVGGSMMAFLGARLAFRYLGIVAGISAVLYAVIYYGFLRKPKSANLVETKAKEESATETRCASVDCKVAINESNGIKLELHGRAYQETDELEGGKSQDTEKSLQIESNEKLEIKETMDSSLTGDR